MDSPIRSHVLLDLYKGDLLSVIVAFAGHTNMFICHMAQIWRLVTLFTLDIGPPQLLCKLVIKSLKTCPFHNWMSWDKGKFHAPRPDCSNPSCLIFFDHYLSHGT